MNRGNPKWQKGGASPNPGGRPKATVHVAVLARQYTEEAILKLVAIMRNGKATTTAQWRLPCLIVVMAGRHRRPRSRCAGTLQI